MKTRLLILFTCISVCCAIGGVLLRGSGNHAPGRFEARPRLVTHAGQDSVGLPGPLIRTDSPYLDGRADWFSQRLNGLFRDTLDQNRAPGSSPRVVIHRQPFSEGPWLATLSDSEAQTRQSVESQTVEAHLVLEVSGIRSERLLQFVIFSGFQKKIEGIGKLEHELFFYPLSTPLPELGAGVDLEAHQYICRETTQRPEFLAQPTACYYMFDARRVGDAYILRYDLLANSPDAFATYSAGIASKEPATVRLSVGQYVIIPSPAGSRLHHTAYYSGQSMPALFDDFVKDHTVDFYENMEKTIRALAPSWNVPAEAESWIEIAFR